MITAVSFTGGKDSVLALHLAAGYRHGAVPAAAWAGGPQPLPPVALLVTFAPAADADFKAHPLPVVRALAAALGLPHELCVVRAPYLDGYAAALAGLRRRRGVAALVTGDMADVAGGFMDAAAAAAGVALVRPLWQLRRPDALAALLGLGIRARISCVDARKYVQAPARRGGQRQQQQQQEEEGREREDGGGGACSVVAAPAAGARGGAAAAAQRPPLPALTQQQRRVEQQQQQQQQGEEQQQHVEQCNFDPVAQLLGRELTPELVQGPLAQAERLFGADLAGEGGEYHTLVFACPMMARGGGVRLVPRGPPRCGGGGGGGAPTGHVYVEWEVAAGPHDAWGGGAA